MKRSARLSIVLAVIATLACEAGEPPSGGAGAAANEDAAGDTAEARASAPTPGAVAPINRSGVRGTASLARIGDDRLLELELEGMEPGARYTAQVHEGRCVDAPGGGAIVLPLGRIVAREDGTGRTRMRMASDRLPADSALFVQVHTADDRPVACANLER